MYIGGNWKNVDHPYVCHICLYILGQEIAMQSSQNDTGIWIYQMCCLPMKKIFWGFRKDVSLFSSQSSGIIHFGQKSDLS